MQYQDLVCDFAQRTRANLEAIEWLRNQSQHLPAYEITQLINSLLGLLVFPQQEFVNSIPATPLTQLQFQGWPIPKIVGNFQQVKDLRQLVRYLRNAIAHFNIEFTADAKDQINGLRVWNDLPNNGPTNWKAELSIGDVKVLADKFVDLVLSRNS